MHAACASALTVSSRAHVLSMLFFFFFFNDTATTEIYTLSLHDALPISKGAVFGSKAGWERPNWLAARSEEHTSELQSRFGISYAVFCLKKKQTHERVRVGTLGEATARQAGRRKRP